MKEKFVLSRCAADPKVVKRRAKQICAKLSDANQRGSRCSYYFSYPDGKVIVRCLTKKEALFGASQTGFEGLIKWQRTRQGKVVAIIDFDRADNFSIPTAWIQEFVFRVLDKAGWQVKKMTKETKNGHNSISKMFVIITS